MPRINVISASHNLEGEVERKDKIVGYTWLAYTQSTSLHGIKHAFEPNYRRIIWMIGLLGMLGALLYIISNLVVDYYRYPYRNSVKISVVDRVTLPQMTLCNFSPFNASSTDKADEMNDILVRMSSLNFLPFTPINYSTPEYAFANIPNTREELMKMAFSVDSTFKNCKFRGEVKQCNDLLESKITDMGPCFTTKATTSDGTDLLSTDITGSEAGLELYFVINQQDYIFGSDLCAGYKVLLHDPAEEPDMGNKGFLVSPGFTTYASVKYTKYKYLPSPYKAFDSVTCLDTNAPGFINPLNYSNKYDVTTCFKECRVKYMLEKCGCVDLIDFGNYTLCSLKVSAECYHPYKAKFNTIRQKECNCQTPCDFNKFEVQLSTTFYPSLLALKVINRYFPASDLRTEVGEIRIFFEELVETEIKQEPVYNIDNIVATLGGQMGIFLGASVLTVSEFIEYGLITLWSLFKRIFIKKI